MAVPSGTRVDARRTTSSRSKPPVVSLALALALVAASSALPAVVEAQDISLTSFRNPLLPSFTLFNGTNGPISVTSVATPTGTYADPSFTASSDAPASSSAAAAGSSGASASSTATAAPTSTGSSGVATVSSSTASSNATSSSSRSSSSSVLSVTAASTNAAVAAAAALPLGQRAWQGVMAPTVLVGASLALLSLLAGGVLVL